jgi:bifunctional UDP-N-acetylglucosamine pyrophosphorylase / glucosamine-1-phosphate N-acetyltransferase
MLNIIILAAGKGSRLNSPTPKALQKVAHFSFLEIILRELQPLNFKQTRVVVSKELQENEEFKGIESHYKFLKVLQEERRGTGHAVKLAVDHADCDGVFLILNVDSPLIESDTLASILKSFSEQKLDLMSVGFKAKNPQGFGRLITNNTELIRIAEDDAANHNGALCNSGIYVVDGVLLKQALSMISPSNKTQEYYLTDIVNIAVKQNKKVGFFEIAEENAFGVNTKEQLLEAQEIMQNRLRAKAFSCGVTMIDASSIFYAYDTKFSEGVTIWPYNVFGRGVSLEKNSEIKSFCHIEGATIGEGSVIGPFARLRKGTVLGANVKIGNFVETKAVSIGNGSKLSHLTYAGDAEIGNNVNIGAGTVFCNYDGYNKNKAYVEDNVFVGSNSSLVSPLRVGEDSIIAAGSVVTDDVPSDTLCFGRARQVNYAQKALISKSKLQLGKK